MQYGTLQSIWFSKVQKRGGSRYIVQMLCTSHLRSPPPGEYLGHSPFTDVQCSDSPALRAKKLKVNSPANFQAVYLAKSA